MLHQLSERYLRPIAIIPNLEINWRAFRILEKDSMPYTKSGIYYSLNKNSKFAQTQAPKRAVTRGSFAAGRGATFNRPGAPAPMPTETKYFDTSFQNTVSVASDWTGSEVACTSYIQSDGTTVGSYTDSALIPSAIGAGYGQINGNKYYLKKLRIRGVAIPTYTADQTDVLQPASIRLTVVMDTQPQGAQAQGESIFTDMGTAAQTHFSFMAMAAGSGGRFQVLKDKTIMIQPAVAAADYAALPATNSGVRTGINFKFNMNWKKPLHVMLKANSATPTVASLSNYNIFIIAHCTQATPVLTINGVARAYFSD